MSPNDLNPEQNSSPNQTNANPQHASEGTGRPESQQKDSKIKNYTHGNQDTHDHDEHLEVTTDRETPKAISARCYLALLSSLLICSSRR